jgi:hypothetical protein
MTIDVLPSDKQSTSARCSDKSSELNLVDETWWRRLESLRRDLCESRLCFGDDAYDRGRHARERFRVGVGDARRCMPHQQDEGRAIGRLV